ncbi:MAG: cytochrome c oxidase assembly protein [Firmicutes bacterium]|nr:cytochrome c oxidase assembly protein [Bacillota bacterium]
MIEFFEWIWLHGSDWIDWFHPGIAAGCALCAGLYWWFAVATPRRRRIDSPSHQAQQWFCYSGLATVYAAVGSPLDVLADSSLFTAHMLQHLLLCWLAAPLVVRAVPTRWLLPLRLRIRHQFFQLVCPAIGGTLFVVWLSIYHLPFLMEAGLNDETIHFFEHAALFLTAVAFYWPIYAADRGQRLSAVGRMVYVFIVNLLCLPISLMLLFSSTPWYVTYAAAPRLMDGFSAIWDQKVGALLMIVAGWVAAALPIIQSFEEWLFLSEKQVGQQKNSFSPMRSIQEPTQQD